MDQPCLRKLDPITVDLFKFLPKVHSLDEPVYVSPISLVSKLTLSFSLVIMVVIITICV